MLSRILRDGAGIAAEPIQWPGTEDDAGPAEAAAGACQIAALEEQVRRQASEAHRAGYREGEAAGRRLAAAEVEPVMERLGRTIEEITRLRPRMLRDCEADLVELALAVARRILHRELSVDPGALEGIVKAALEKAAGGLSRLRTHPELEPAIRRALQQAGQSGVELIADANLERGGLILETARGKLDASLDTQLAEIGRGLIDRLPEPFAER